MTPREAWSMSIFGLSIGLFGILLLGFLLVAVVPWAFRSIGESLAEFRANRDDRPRDS